MTTTTSDPSVTYELRDRVALLTIDDGKANAITHGIADALLQSLERARTEADAVVLAGRPGRFSAGFDLSVMTSGTTEARALLGAGAEVSIAINGFPKPVVLAATGHALAMGAILLLAGDVRIGAEGNFKIGLNEVAIGMPVPRFTVELARGCIAVGALNAAINLATVYDPAGAVAAGFLDRTVPEGEVVDAAIAEATELAGRLNARAFAETRSFVRAASIERVRAGLADDLRTFVVDLPEA